MRRGDWNVVDHHRHFEDEVPAEPGVYAIVQSKRVLGVPLAATPVYVGRSTNLRRRFFDHTDPLREHNTTLRQALLKRLELEFWFTTLPKAQLELAEREAIRKLQPIANLVRYTGDPANDR
jgi:excinuclease UvrABC nuclease subunit